MTPGLDASTSGAVVSTAWLAAHLDDPQVRVIDATEDSTLYEVGHIEGALPIACASPGLVDRRGYILRARFDDFMARIGATPRTQLICYGDGNNWWASYAFWVLQLFGHARASILSGGRSQWLAEGRPLTTATPFVLPTRYRSALSNGAPRRVSQDEVLVAMEARAAAEIRGRHAFHRPAYENPRPRGARCG